MIWNVNVCLDEIFEIDKFKIKIMGLWKKKNLKWYFTVTEWHFTIKKIFRIKYLKCLKINKYFDNFSK